MKNIILITYASSFDKSGKKGTIALNGPAARKGLVGDLLIIFCYAFYDEEEAQEHCPTIVLVDHNNRMVSKHQPSQWDLDIHEGNLRISAGGTRR